MTAPYIDQLLALGEKLKQDVEESGKPGADVFLPIWSSIEQSLLDEDFDLMSAREPKSIFELSLREGLVDIGRCYLSDDGRLPNDQQVAEQWLMIGAEWGSLMGQMLLLKINIASGKTAYDPRWLQAFRKWQAEEKSADFLWKNQIKRFDKLRSVAFELGLQAAVALKDPTLAEEVLGFMQAISFDDLPLIGLQWQAELLLRQNDPAPEYGRQILGNLTPGNDAKENQALSRFKALLRPLPLQTWPESPSWAEDLRREYPWMSPVMDRLENEWALRCVTGQPVLKFRPLLLVGNPGLGKSRFVQSLGEALGLPTAFLMMAGMNDNMMLKGTARGWGSARAGYLVEFMLENRQANPLVCLDEIEKVGTSKRNGRLWETLLTMLEPATASRITDEYLLGSVDYSAVNWVATANDVSDLPKPLRSRFTIIRVGEPEGGDFDRIFTSTLQDIARDLGTESWALPTLSPEIVEKLRRQFRRYPGSLRQLAVTTRSLLQLEAKAQMDEGGALRRSQ
ncbi:MAG: AAA family ATPase [Planctomycetia bacterium]|nr:AAA family ATPase [Planctomycetia bacterium]